MITWTVPETHKDETSSEQVTLAMTMVGSVSVLVYWHYYSSRWLVAAPNISMPCIALAAKTYEEAKPEALRTIRAWLQSRVDMFAAEGIA